ncbi:MAG: hypothetical protein GTO14_02125 [Anaerolineales bacterium]|nr:hypothetical protein [Anaerolineales bacterium]
MHRRTPFICLLLLGVALVLAACAGPAGEPGAPGATGPAGPQGPQGDPGPPGEMAELTCLECHNDTNVIAGKAAAFAETLHATGHATAYAGARTRCSGCHSGGGFTDAIAAGVTPGDEQESADPNPSRPDCRACHQIHTSYTAADWALTTTDPVALFAFEDTTFDGGMGNLCSNCHQPRRQIAEAVDGQIEITSTHWGPHHGPQSAVLLGLGGAGDVEGSASAHYSMVEDTCVSCHLGEGDVHTFEPDESACTGCHTDLEDFDLNGVQTEVEELAAELGEKLEAAGLIHEGHPNPGTYPAAQAQAAWNWILIVLEDSSSGVHNPAYIKALLEESLAAFD